MSSNNNNNDTHNNTSHNYNKNNNNESCGTTHQNKKKRKKRQICTKCHRPQPQTCICSALPTPSITLSKCKVFVLQHPHEQRRKNRSLPLVELCFHKNSSSSGSIVNTSCGSARSSLDTTSSREDNNDGISNINSNSHDNKIINELSKKEEEEEEEEDDDNDDIVIQDFNCIIARRLGDQVNPKFMELFYNLDYNFLLVYPTNESITLKEALLTNNNHHYDNNNDMIKNDTEEEEIKQRSHQKMIDNDDNTTTKTKDIIKKNDTTSKDDNKKIILFFIDATWKYANEMIKTGIKLNVWPLHTKFVKLTKDDFHSEFQPRRFDIRTPPDPSSTGSNLDQLSTAECIAHCLRIVEGKDDIFDLLMKPLDLMVQQWHSFYDDKTIVRER